AFGRERIRKEASLPTGARDDELSCRSSLGSIRGHAERRSNLHGRGWQRRLDANRSSANRKKRNVENGLIPITWNTLRIGWYAPNGFDRRGRTVAFTYQGPSSRDCSPVRTAHFPQIE